MLNSRFVLGARERHFVRFHFPAGQNYDCIACGRSCNAPWQVPAEPVLVERLLSHSLGIRVIQDEGPLFDRLDGGGWVINKKNSDGLTCVFQDSQKYCRIHSELGAEQKPRVCQMFPFTLVGTPDGVYVGTSFFCTSVRENSGRPLREHADWLKGMVARAGRLTQVEPQGISLRPGVLTNWEDYLGWEGQLLSRPLTYSLLACARSQPYQLFAAWNQECGAELKLVERLVASATYAVVKLFLCEARPERVQSFDHAFLNEEALELEEFGWSGTWNQLQDALCLDFESDLRRWSDMQVHRKYLIASGHVLDNLWTLALVPPFVQCLTVLYAHREKRPASRLDFYQALEQAELYLGSNSLRLARLTPHFSAHLMETLGSESSQGEGPRS
jgi:Fe-S-cluster containining protein